MSLKNLSFLLALYGLLVLACSVFCLWAGALFSSALLSLAGFSVMALAHFFNRGRLWGFSGSLFLLVVLAAVFGWYLVTYFRTKTAGFSPEKVADPNAWLVFFGGLFILTLIFLMLAISQASKVRKELP